MQLISWMVESCFHNFPFSSIRYSYGKYFTCKLKTFEWNLIYWIILSTSNIFQSVLYFDIINKAYICCIKFHCLKVSRGYKFRPKSRANSVNEQFMWNSFFFLTPSTPSWKKEIGDEQKVEMKNSADTWNVHTYIASHCHERNSYR